MRALVPICLTGCFIPTAVPTAIHPTGEVTDKTAGVAIGGAYATSETSSLVMIPSGEGWLRHPAGPGQVGIHAGTNVAHVSYRYDVLKLADGIGLGIEPFLGGSYYRSETKPMDPMDPKILQSLATFSIGITPTLLIPVAQSFAYIVPKFGFQIVDNLAAAANTDSTTNFFTLGLSAGIDIGGGLSFELGIHYIDDTEGNNNLKPTWLIVPTIGVKH